MTEYDYIAYFDGATEPVNPGGAQGIGVAIYKGGCLIKTYSYYIPARPNNTNNVAEYMAFIRILKWIKEFNIEGNMLIRGDSMLVIQQMNGNWSIKNGMYVKYAMMAKKMLYEIKNNIQIEWVRRDFNEKADELSKKELIKNGIRITKR